MKNFFKKPLFITIVVIIIVIGYRIIYPKNKVYDFTVAERSNITQEVSATGRIEPVENVDLAFEKTGRVSNIFVAVGDKVNKEQVLINLDNSELSAQLAKAQAGLESIKAQAVSVQASKEMAENQLIQSQATLEAEKAKLDELKSGTRPEEIKISETKVANAQKSLEDAKINLENIQNKAEADLEDAYDKALTALQNAVNIGRNALITLTDIQYSHFNTNEQDSFLVASTKEKAVESLLGEKNGGRLSKYYVSLADGGAFAAVNDVVKNPTQVNIDAVIIKVIDALQKVKDALDTVPVTTDFTSTEATNLSTEKSNVNTQISTISTKQQTISVQKATNNYNISVAQTSINEAQSALDNARDDLALKQAGYNPKQITAQSAAVKKAEANLNLQKTQIKQAEANVENLQAQVREAVANIQTIQAQIEKGNLKSPIDGLVSKVEVKVGEIVSANTIIVSIISENKSKIETNIPEADIAKVKVGDSARVDLDAYSTGTIFEAVVTSIDPSEKIIEGVATYKTRLDFLKDDERIKPGMTANINIITSQKENVITIPQRSILTKDGEKIVRIIDNKGTIKEVKIRSGILGNNGEIEIIEGINKGDKVLNFAEGE